MRPTFAWHLQTIGYLLSLRSRAYRRRNMTLFRHAPGCPCCDHCRIDSFTAEIEVSTANATTIRSAVHPQVPYPSWLRADVKAETTAIVRLFFLWDDSTPGDGIYVEFIPDSPTSEAGSISVYTKDDTRIAGPWYVYGGVSDAWHTITLCYDPDTDPEEMVITFEPAGTYYDTTPAQSFNVLLPDTFTVGTKSGYGSGNGSGSVWFKDYTFDRLWYCGSSPYASDCHELGDDWDYYNDLPARTTCHPCTRCPAGPRISTESDWLAVSGSWTWPARTTSSDARLIAIAGQSDWQMYGNGGVSLMAAGDEAIFGWSDIISYNQVYVKYSVSSGTRSVVAGSYYDERDSRFYFWLVGSAQFNITYTVYSVTNGGSPAVVMGPTPATAALDPSGTFYLVTADNYTTLHASMRHAMIGTGDNSATGTIVFAGLHNQCDCGGYFSGVPTLRPPRKYTATVAGVTQGDWDLGLGVYFDYTLLNRGPVSLRNYFHTSPSTPYTTPCPNCCHSNYAIPSGLQSTWFYGTYQNGYTELHGYAYAFASTKACEIHFRKLIYGKHDLRTLSGEVLDYYEMLQSTPTAPYERIVDPRNATFTITSVV